MERTSSAPSHLHESRNSGRYASALFPEAAPTPVTVPDWMQSIDAGVRNAEFDRTSPSAYGDGDEGGPEGGYFNQISAVDNRKASSDEEAEDPFAGEREALEQAQQALGEDRASLTAEREELEKSAHAVRALMKELEEQAEAARSVAAGEIAEIAIAVAEAIIGDGLDPERAGALVDAALGPLGDAATARVGMGLAVLLEVDGDDNSSHIVADASLPPLACVAESERGIIDAGVEARLDAARRALDDSQ